MGFPPCTRRTFSFVASSFLAKGVCTHWAFQSLNVGSVRSAVRWWELRCNRPGRGDIEEGLPEAYAQPPMLPSLRGT